MKKCASMLMILMLSAASFAGSLEDYPTVRDAMNNDNIVLYSYWGCLEDGYELNTIDVQPIYYLVAPEGEHLFGTVTITMIRRARGNSLRTEYVFIKCNVIAGDNGMRMGDVNITRQTVN